MFITQVGTTWSERTKVVYNWCCKHQVASKENSNKRLTQCFQRQLTPRLLETSLNNLFSSNIRIVVKVMESKTFRWPVAASEVAAFES